jgi:hypothetical protein
MKLSANDQAMIMASFADAGLASVSLIHLQETTHETHNCPSRNSGRTCHCGDGR